jgi:hypothetical protein
VKPDWPQAKLPLAEVLDNVRKALRGNNPLDGKNTSVSPEIPLCVRLACCPGSSVYSDKELFLCLLFLQL